MSKQIAGLSTFIKTERVRKRHLRTPAGRHLDGFLSYRGAQGFARASIESDLERVTAFGEYLANTDKASLNAVSEADIEAFIEHYRSCSRNNGPKRRTPRGSVSMVESLRGSLRVFLAYLRSIGAAMPPVEVDQGTRFDAALDEYLKFLRDHRGFLPRSIAEHERWARAFFAHLADQRPQVDLGDLSSSDVERVWLDLCDGLDRRSRQIMTTKIESLTRYLRTVGRIPLSCIPFLPRIKTYALSSLPSAIPWADVERAIEGIERETVMGRRDHAIVTLAATYGLRASELASLQFDDIDWRSGAIRIRQTKTRNALELPLLPRVRDALVPYLQDRRRAPFAGRRVFLKCHAPEARRVPDCAQDPKASRHRGSALWLARPSSCSRDSVGAPW